MNNTNCSGCHRDLTELAIITVESGEAMCWGCYKFRAYQPVQQATPDLRSGRSSRQCLICGQVDAHTNACSAVEDFLEKP